MQSSKKINSSKSSLITAVDVGSTKIACFIAQPLGEGELQIVGIGHQVSKGIKSGNIVDMDLAEQSIRATVESAEQMAGENVKEITVCFSGGSPESKLISFDVSISGHEIGDGDLHRALDPTWIYSQQTTNRKVIHTLPVSYSVDDNRGVVDPRGMYAEKLGINMHIMTAGTGALRNLESSIHRCHLEIDSFVTAPYAAGLSCLVSDEKDLGAICIDMGGGTTTISGFFDNQIMFVDSIPIGGSHVTKDIARGISAPVADSERMKNLYGSVIPTPSDDQEYLKTPLVGENENESNQIPRSMLVSIIRPRVEEIFELVRAKLKDNGFDKMAGRRVVLTGGASQLNGVSELAGSLLDKQVRLGRPININGLAESVNGPAFSVCAGLVQFTLNKRFEGQNPLIEPFKLNGGHLGRLGQWLRGHI